MGGLSVGPIHHVRMTVTDVERSKAFYTEVLGFQVAVEAPPPADDPHHDLVRDSLQGGVVLVNGGLLFGLRPVDADRLAGGDRFDPFRVGLDHVSFTMGSRDDLLAAAKVLDDHGVEHGEVTDLTPFGIALLSVSDPDGIQLELTAPL